MVNVPSHSPVIIPRHSIFELEFDVLNQLLSATSYQIKCMVGFLMALKDEKESPAQVGENTILGVFPMLNGKSLFYLLNVLLVGGVMAVTIGAFYAHLSVAGISMIKMSQILPQVPCVFLGPLFMFGLSAFFAFAIIVTAVEIELVQRLVCLALSFTCLLVHTYKCGLSRGKCEKTEDLTFYRSVLYWGVS